MDTLSAKLFAAEIDHNLPTVDLHGLFPDEAKNKLDNFLFDSFNKKSGAIRVVYGIGTGKLKEEILLFLGKHGLVEALQDEGASAVAVLTI